MSSMREKVTFQTNVPVEVVLSYAEGKVCTGQFGDSLMYSLENNRVMFVPPIVGDRIGALGVDAGDALLITKAEIQTGTRKRIEWKVIRAEGAGRSSDASPAPARTVLERTQTQPTTVGRIALAPRSVAPTPGRLSLPRNYVPPLAAPAASPGDQLGALLETCLVDAMIAAMRAEKSGQAIGCTLRFTSEDVRCISATLFIARSKGGAR